MTKRKSNPKLNRSKQMKNQNTNKSILIDADNHEKAKILASKFKISVKQLVEEMIFYCDKTGFNPSTMSRDIVLTKLNQFEKLLLEQSNKSQPDKTLENRILHQLGSIKEDTNAFSSSLSSLSSNFELVNRKNITYSKFIQKLFFDQKRIVILIREKYPNFPKSNCGFPSQISQELSEFMHSFYESQETHSALFKKL